MESSDLVMKLNGGGWKCEVISFTLKIMEAYKVKSATPVPCIGSNMLLYYFPTSKHIYISGVKELRDTWGNKVKLLRDVGIDEICN